jgi:hypothetical protein
MEKIIYKWAMAYIAMLHYWREKHVKPAILGARVPYSTLIFIHCLRIFVPYSQKNGCLFCLLIFVVSRFKMQKHVIYKHIHFGTWSLPLWKKNRPGGAVQTRPGGEILHGQKKEHHGTYSVNSYGKWPIFRWSTLNYIEYHWITYLWRQVI